MKNYRIYVEKLPRFRVEAESLRRELNADLGLSLRSLRLLNVYDLFGFGEDPSSARQGEHLGEGGGVHAGVMRLGNLSGTQVKTGNEVIYKGGLANSTITGKQGRFTAQNSPQCIHSLTRTGRNLNNLIANGSVEIAHGFQILAVLLGFKQVYLVEQQRCRNIISLGSCQKAIDKSKSGCRMSQCCHKHGAINIGGNDAGGLAEIGCAADDAVAPVGHRRDIADAIRTRLAQSHRISNRHRIGRADVLDSEITLDASRHIALFRPHNIRRPCIFYNYSLHNNFKLSTNIRIFSPLSITLNNFHANCSATDNPKLQSTYFI